MPTRTLPAWYFPSIEKKGRKRFGCYPVPCRVSLNRDGSTLADAKQGSRRGDQYQIFAVVAVRAARGGYWFGDYDFNKSDSGRDGVETLYVETSRVVLMHESDLYQLPKQLCKGTIMLPPAAVKPAAGKKPGATARKASIGAGRRKAS